MSWRDAFSAVFGLTAAVLVPLPASAAPTRVALVVGNGTYGSLPVLASCPLSAHAVSAALRRLGFDVVESEDTTSGGLDAAIGTFSSHLTAVPGAAALVYICGYGTAYNDRPFLLPVSAAITRPSDVFTQGVLARTLLDALERGKPSAAVLALDVVPAPGSPAQLGLQSLAPGMPDTIGMIAAVEAKPAGGPTLLATALVSALAGPVVQSGPLLAALDQQLGGSKATTTIAAMAVPAVSGYLAGAPEPPPPAAVARAAEPPPPPPPVEPASAAAPTHAATPQIVMPDQAQMTDQQRRQVQIALATLGYYGGRIDGVFGPDTQAAIRRFQHEIHADMTGALTAAEATRLASTAAH
ncbi:MAG: peptidoglycan-binding protein [Acetobacteraceae bacterium]